MARSVFYREKSGPGPWQRATGTPPFNVTGLVNGTTYEFDVGDGTLADMTPNVQGLARTANQTIVNSTETLEIYDSTDLFASGLTAAPGSGRLMVLFVALMAHNGVTPAPVTATFGTQAFESLISYVGIGSAQQILFIREADIPDGAQNITIDTSNDGGRACLAQLVEYQGVDQVAPFGTPVSDFNTDHRVTITIGGNIALGLFATRGIGALMTPITIDGGATLLVQAETGAESNTDVAMAVSEEVILSPGTVTRNFATSNISSTPWTLGVELRAA